MKIQDNLLFARLVVLSLLLGTTFSTTAQESSSAQIIRLKTGGSFQGSISEISNETYQIILIAGDTITLKKKSIAAVIEQKKAYHIYPDGKFTPTKGSYFSFLIGASVGYNESDEWNPMNLDFSPLSFSAGYRFTQKIELGVGASFDIYSNYGCYLPLFAEGRYYLSKKPTSLFIGGKVGRSLFLNPTSNFLSNESKGGILIYPNFGFKCANRRKGKFLLEAGLKIQKAIFERWNATDHLTIYRYTLGAGWLF